MYFINNLVGKCWATYTQPLTLVYYCIWLKIVGNIFVRPGFVTVEHECEVEVHLHNQIRKQKNLKKKKGCKQCEKQKSTDAHVHSKCLKTAKIWLFLYN